MSKERMQKQKEDNLRKILDAAWQIAADEGMEAISVRKIASAMNFAPNNLYNYFTNKSELIRCMKTDSYQWAIDIIANYHSEEDSVCMLFKHISECLLKCALKSPEKYIVMTSDVILDENDPLDHQLTDIFAKRIQEGIDSGEIIDVDPVVTSMNLRTIQMGFVRMVSANKSISAEEAFRMHDNLMNILFTGIKRRD